MQQWKTKNFLESNTTLKDANYISVQCQNEDWIDFGKSNPRTKH